jgi:hypothetical protein
MEIELSAEAKDKALNRRVAITVVIFSVAAGLCNIKDGNVVQAMQQAQAASLDKWNESIRRPRPRCTSKKPVARPFQL